MSNIARYLRDARREKTALAAFNAPGPDVMRSIATAAADINSPAIIQTSLSTVRSYGVELLKGWFDVAKSVTGSHIFLHLDHCSEPEVIANCIDAGWDMVMYDGSHLPYDRNLSNTQNVVRLARRTGTAVEAELGGIGGAEDGAGTHTNVADPGEIVEFAAESGVDCLAIGFGNAHGHYSDTTDLQWGLLESAGQSIDTPMVLHGGTGLSDDELLLAVHSGCAKVNISTALKDVYAELRAASTSSAMTDGNPLAFHEALHENTHTVCSRYIKLLGNQVA